MVNKLDLKPEIKQLRKNLLIIGWIFVFLFPPVVPCLLVYYERERVRVEQTEIGVGCCTDKYFLCGMVDVCCILLTILGWVPGSIFAAIILSTI